MIISIVTSLYYSKGYVANFYERMSKAVQEITDDYEFIFVSDGKTDDSNVIVQKIIEQDKKVRLVELAVNSGAAAARWEGMKLSKGEFVFTLDADLEEDPVLIQKFYSKFEEDEETDVVFGYLENRKGGLFEQLSGWLFYKIFIVFSGIKLKGSPVWVRLMRRKYVDALVAHGEKHLFAIGLMKIIGFNQVGIPIIKKNKGYSSYSFTQKLSQTADSIISFSDKPLKIISITGIIIATLALLFIGYLTVSKLFFHQYQSGWTSLIASVFLIGGINLAAVGIVGLYVGKTFQQTKNRPRTIIRKTYNL